MNNDTEDKPTKTLYIVGTFDTKGSELFFIKNQIQRFFTANSQTFKLKTIDVSALLEHCFTHYSPADISPEYIAHYHPDKLPLEEIFVKDRGQAIEKIINALTAYITTLTDVGAIIGIGGSGGTALIAPALRELPVGIPKVLVSTVASGNIKPYIGACDITMMYSVADIAGLNRITTQILTNAANAIAGMALPEIAQNNSSTNINSSKNIKSSDLSKEQLKPAIGITMFGVTTPCVNAINKQLEDSFDCLVFHATGSGGQAMEKLASSGNLCGVLDVTTTEIADYLFGGVFSAGVTRLDSIIQSKIPYVGSAGAIDMVNFGSPETIPAQYANRVFHKHNPQVTLMRTSVDENIAMAIWIANKLNQCQGEVRFLFPTKGVSLLSEKGQPFYHPEADEAFIETLKKHFKSTPHKQIITLPYAINDSEFSAALTKNFLSLKNISPSNTSPK